MNKYWLAVLSVLLCSTLAKAAVTVDANGERRQYNENPRLVEVLQPYALQQQWYWPAASLFRTDTSKAEKLRRELLALATEISQQTDDASLSESLALLQAQVNSWQLADRVTIVIDYDAATAKPALNPRFDSGRYVLQLSRRPVMVHIGGAVKRSITTTHLSASPVSAYAVNTVMTTGADRSQLAVVQPDGRIVKAGISYWNENHVEAMPGAQLLVLFAEPLLDKRFATLNTLLQQLAVHRILP